MDLHQFQAKRTFIKSRYEIIKEIAGNLGIRDLEQNLEESMELLENDRFNIVVVGEFSRGKSTFINALLGQRVLPSATKPTTAVINKITAGDQVEIILNFRNEDKQVILTEEQFKKLVAPIEPDPEDAQEVQQFTETFDYISSISYATIKYPTQLLMDGIEIIDTPGTNDMDQAREEITFTFIPQSDAAILVLSATQILSDSEVSFLKERILGNDIRKIFFVVNAKDKLKSPEDQQKIFDYAYEHLKNYVDNPRIFMVSSKGALSYKRSARGETVKGIIPEHLEETGFDVLEHEISTYLINERGKIKLDKYYQRGTKIASEIVNRHIQYKLNTVGLSVKELEQKINDLVPIVRETKQQALGVINRLKTSLTGLENDYVYLYQNGLEDTALRANMAISNYTGPLEIENIARQVEETVAPLQRQLDEQVKQFKIRMIDSEIDSAAKKLEKIFNDLNINIDHQLALSNTSVGLPAKHHDLTVNPSPTISAGEGIFGGLIVGGAAFLLFSAPFIIIPAAMFGGKYIESMLQSKKRNNFLAEVKIQIERRYGEIIPNQVSSFRKAFHESINHSISILEDGITQKMDGLESQLKNLLDEKKAAQADANQEIARLNRLQNQLQTIINEFKKELI